MRIFQNPPRGRAETARPTQEFRIVRATQGYDGKKKETVGRRHGIPPHTPPAVPPDFLNFRDFQRKKFELHPKNSAISQETQNPQKMTKESQNVEGGAEFPPETPLPPRPHLCWRFWEFLLQMQKENAEKK